MNRALMETAWSLIAHAGLPDCYWAETVAAAVYLRNCLPTTAFQILGMYLKLFGYMAYAHIPDVKQIKLDKMAEII